MEPQTTSLTTNSEPSSKASNGTIRYDAITYRSQEIQFLSDPSGTHCFGKWRDEIVDLGLNNIYYKEDMCRFIDQRLDLITAFPEIPELSGAQLKWFNNNGYRDIYLLYKGRILKVFMVNNPEIVDTEALKQEAIRLLYKSGLLESSEIDPISDCP